MVYHPKSEKERISHRLKISHGHLGKVIEMIEKEKNCIDIIHQLKAIQRALKETDMLIVDNHLQNCLKKDITDKKIGAIDDLMILLNKYNNF